MKFYIRIDTCDGKSEELRWTATEGKFRLASSTLAILRALHKAGKMVEKESKNVR